MPFSFSFLSTRPAVKVTAQLVTSKSPWLTHVLTLGFYSRTVVIDSRTKTVRIRVRYLWGFWKHHMIAFDQVEYVTFEMRETGETTSYFTFDDGLFAAKFVGRNDFNGNIVFRRVPFTP